MNSQFTPGLSEIFAQQEHQHLLKEAANARLAHQATNGTRPIHIFTIRKPARKLEPAPDLGPQPNATTAASIAVLTFLAALKLAVLVAL